MTKQEYQLAVYRLTQEWLDAELKRAKDKGLSPDDVDVYIDIKPEFRMIDKGVVRYHCAAVDANMVVKM